ncbi:MAG: IS91 family transposase [Bacteroidetes bacterium]|nr:IS91 family transposase [Bacteroidota bacterium]
MKPRFEVADVIGLHADAFRQKYQLTGQVLRTLKAIEQCRTPALGGHVDLCDACSHLRISYNSCRNRHCPKCQTVNREKWIAAREADLLPIAYFHLIFTLPDTLNPLCLQQPKVLYNILFRSSWETVLDFAKDPKHLGAKPGMVAILHTWGQNISLHPHIHCIFPGGGITAQGKWKESRNKGKFLFPVKAMSKVFRAKFVSKLRQWAKEEKQDITRQLFDELFKKAWVVYAKQPFGGPKQVVEYLGRYTHKVAISNHRLLHVGKQGITFTWKDYRHGNSKKQMQLSGQEFLRRFCQHILPYGFMRIRHYGILSSRCKTEKLQQARSDLKTEAPPKPDLNWKVIALQRLNYNPDQCPHCKKGQMITVLHFDGCHGPPNKHLLQKLKKRTMKPKEKAT